MSVMLRVWIYRVSAAAVVFTIGCSVTEVDTDQLAQVVERDAIAFSLQTPPDNVIARLADNRVILVGETHWIYEHRDLMAMLVRELHAHGFRQILLEFPEPAEWMLDDYMSGGILLPDWTPPLGLNGDIVTAAREFNETVPEGERVRVRGIDVLLDEYGGADAFVDMMRTISQHLEHPGSISELVNGPYGDPETQKEALQVFQHRLESEADDLTSTWGEYWYEMVTEMAKVENVSIEVRRVRNSDYDESVKLREDAMKQMTDQRLRNYAYKTLINVGGNHAQKSRLKGTDQEWLGDYLVHKSTAVGGSIVVLSAAPTRIVDESGTTELWNIIDESPPNELWRVMSEFAPGKVVFLPLDDPLFKSEGVLINYEDVIYNTALEEVYDILIALPVAHRVPSSSKHGSVES